MKKAKVISLILCGALIALIFSCASGGGGKFTTLDVPASAWDWVVNGDDSNGGTSTIAMTEGTQEGMPAYSFKGNITNEYEYGFVNVKVYPDTPTLEKMKTISAFSFKILGDGDRYAIKITTSDITDYAYYEYAFDTIEGQPVVVIVPINFLMQPSWGKGVGSMVNLENAQFFEFQTTRNGSPGPFEFTLWDIRLYANGVPQEKDISKGVKTKAAPAAAKGIGGDLGAFSIKLNDNFQYGDGYQAVFSDKRLFNGHRIVPGETYTLKISFTASRDLEDVIQFGLVDTTPAAQYWKALSWDDNDPDDEGMAEAPAVKAGEKFSATVTFKTKAAATGTAGAANALVFITKGEGKKGVPASGTKKAVTLDISEFVFTEVK